MDRLEGGDDYDRKIQRNIARCSYFIPVVSATTQRRLEGYFRREWSYAIDRARNMADGALFVADAGNNRVMAWRSRPRENGESCDFVLGQADASSVDHNRAAYYPTAGAMNMPYGLSVQDGRLIVADTANSRLIGFELAELDMGVGASRLAAQHADFPREAGWTRQLLTLPCDHRYGAAEMERIADRVADFLR